MRRFILLAAAVAFSGHALAQSRRSTTNMTCAAARTLVQTSKAVVLGTGRDTYDRFVAYDSLCLAGTVATPAFAPTTDNPQCQLGSRCIMESRNDR